MKRTRPADPRLLVSLLAALTTLLLVGCGGATTTPSLRAPGDAHNRVWAFNVESSKLTGPGALRSACVRPGFSLSGAESTAGFCVAAEDGPSVLSRIWSRLADETGSIRPPIKTPWGWTGSASYRSAVSEVAGGGTLETVGGTIPSQAEAEMLIEDAGGTVQRIEGPHLPRNPHQYPHINYTTAEGLRGTVQIAP